MTASAVDHSTVVDIVNKGMALYRSFINGEPLTLVNIQSASTPNSTRTQLSAHHSRGNNTVLNNAALSLYTQLPSNILLRYPRLFEEAFLLFQEQKTMMTMTIPSTSRATIDTSTAPGLLHSPSSSMHSSGYITMLACAGRAHRQEVAYLPSHIYLALLHTIRYNPHLNCFPLLTTSEY